MNATAIHTQDPHYLEKRHRELIPYMQIFSQMLARVYLYSRSTIVYHFDTNEMETILDASSQKAIDNIIEERDKFIKSDFPEFYNPE